jgi:hypothetical protein
VDVLCDQLENPGMGAPIFAMSFTVNNTGRAAATTLVFEVTDSNFKGKSISEASTYTLTALFSPGPSSRRG